MNLESIYQEAIANVPRAYRRPYALDMKDEDFPEKGHGFLVSDLIEEIIKLMTEGTDQEKRSAAAALIVHKTKKGTTRQIGGINLPGCDPEPCEPDRLFRWGDWAIEQKNMTLPWIFEQARQAKASYQGLDKLVTWGQA